MSQLTGPALVAVGALTDVDSTPRNALGTVQVIGGNEYIYLKGATGVAATDWVTYDEEFLVSEVDSQALVPGPVAVALAPVVAGKFGWFQIGGKAAVNSVDDNADNGKVYATATPGRTDDTPILGAQIIGAVYRSVAADNLAVAQLSRPFIGVTDTDTLPG